MLPRVPEWWETLLGCVKGGFVFSPGTTLLTVKDLVYRLEACQARAVVTDAETAATVDAALAQLATQGVARAILRICTDHERPDRMAGIRRARGRGIGHLCRPASPCRRSLAPLLHLRHDRPAKDGPPHPGELCHRAPGDRPLLARQHARRSALDDLRHRLGTGSVDQCLRAMGPGRGRLHSGSAWAIRPARGARAAGPLPDQHLLRAADGLPVARPAAAGQVPLPGAAPHARGGRAGQPRARLSLARGHRPHPLRGLRADRDRAPDGRLPVHAGASGIDGPRGARPCARDRGRGWRAVARRGGGRPCGPRASVASGRDVP